MGFLSNLFKSSRKLSLYCFFLRAGSHGERILMNDNIKSDWIRAIRDKLKLTNAKIILFDATDWNSPDLPPMGPQQLKETLYSIVTGHEVFTAIEQALIKNGVPVSQELLSSNSIVDTIPSRFLQGTETVRTSLATILFSPSLSRDTLKNLMTP